MLNPKPYYDSGEAQKEAVRQCEGMTVHIGWMYEILGIPCPHSRTTTYEVGRRWFANGEVMDDIHDETVCVDCGELVVTPTHKLTNAEWDNLKVEF